RASSGIHALRRWREALTRRGLCSPTISRKRSSMRASSSIPVPTTETVPRPSSAEAPRPRRSSTTAGQSTTRSLERRKEAPPSPSTQSSWVGTPSRSEEHTSELQSRENLVCRLLPERKKHYAEYVADFKNLAGGEAPRQREGGYWNGSLQEPSHSGGKERTGAALTVCVQARGTYKAT